MTLGKHRDFIFVLIVASAYNAIYSIAFMKGLYYTLMQSGLHLSHFRLGQLYSAYGIFSMFSYLCGAFFLNRFSHWRLLAGSSFIVAALTGLLVFIPPYYIMFVIFGIIGFLIGATFYPAHLEVLHRLGGIHNQGRVFSQFFICNSVMGIIFSSVGFSISSLSFSDTQKVQGLFLFFIFLNIGAAVCALIFLRKLPETSEPRSPICFGSLKELLENHRLWLVILIVFVNYLAYTNMNYILPYLKDTFHLSEGLNNILSIFRVYLIGIFAAPIAGRITDRLKSASLLLGISFFLHSLIIIIMVVFAGNNATFVILCLMLICTFVNMGKSMALITIDEAQIHPALYGMAISFISFCAYSPDAFYYSFSGWILDISSKHGYQYIFLIAAAASVIGLAAVYKLRRLSAET